MNIIKKIIGIKTYCIFFGAVGDTRTPWGITRSPLTTTLFPRVDFNEHNINTVRNIFYLLTLTYLI